MSSLVDGQTITPSPYWKNQIVYPNEPFRVVGTSASDPDWVKFTILLVPYDPNIVYFQDSRAYTFHYHFATDLLEPFIGMSPSEYDEVTLYEQGQQAILGAVIMPPTSGYPPPPALPEYGIQFVRRDPYSREEIAGLFNVVKGSIIAEAGVQAFYFPSYEQLATAQANRDWFESEGIPISSTARWAQGNALYSEGWALGELKFFAGAQIEAAYLAGDLLPGDILLTDGVPAEIPFVAGIISLLASTPNSHVAILAKTYGVPFVHLALAEDANLAEQLVGRKIVLRAFDEYGSCDIRLIDVEDVLDDATIAEILALKTLPPLEISPMVSYGAYSAAADGLVPADIQYFGGKAANFGILRTAIADDSPVAVAFSFDLWNEFLDQNIGGNSFRAEIASRLSGYSYPPSDMAALSAELEAIREDLFKDTSVTSFKQQLQNAVIDTLQDPRYGFDENRKIRFRSSTNVEDSNQFTGAGLYDSYSGCLADDLDGDDAGPCICDPNKDNERGVFRAIRKVFASFYNDNAFLERLRHGVNESDVGMALLVHHSFPDEIELANGVATLEKGSGSSRNIMLVTQLGATSVANPEPGSIPEEVSVYVSFSGSIYPTLVCSSSLVPLGGTVMEWQDDYIELSQLLVTAADEFEQVTGKTKYILDFEYKKLAAGGAALPAGGLAVKQVREIPQPNDTPSITPFLINEPAEYCSFQGGFGDVFANHRLKSRWQFETKSFRLTGDNLMDSFYTMATLEYTASARIRTLSGALPLWPFACHTFYETPPTWPYYPRTIDGWFMHHLPNPRTCELHTDHIPLQVSLAENPILTLLDFEWLSLQVEYDQLVPSLDYWNWPPSPTTTTTDEIRLCPCPPPQPGDLLQERSFYDEVSDVNITTSFYWPPPPGMAAGYTAPLSRWVETVIEGYTTEPIVLHGWYSQTYRPEHHNFSEHFIFEPQLEPGISPQILSELWAKNIRLIHMHIEWDYDAEIYVAMHYATEEYGETPFVYGDIDGDGDVDFHDFALLAARWLETVCDECGGADLTGDGQVVLDDLWEFADNWLAGV